MESADGHISNGFLHPDVGVPGTVHGIVQGGFGRDGGAVRLFVSVL